MTAPAPFDRPRTGDIGADEFRAAAHAAVDWIADYLEHPERVGVRSAVPPGAIRDALPAAPPEQGAPLGDMLVDFQRDLLPGITHWNHPSFFAYFAISGSYPGILGELLAAGLNVNGMLWATSPTVTELEEVTLDWLRQLMGLGAGWFGEITDTASVSTFYALAAARESAGLDIRTRGLSGRELATLRVYCSEHAHSSVDKAVIALGLGHDNLVKIAADESFRMRPDALRAAIVRDLEAGHRPIAVVATVGTTSTTSIDPVPTIADVCEAFGVWLHVDGAYGATAAVVPELRHVLDGVDRAQSLVVNPHKWLFTPVDCSVLYTRRPDALRQAFALLPEYLVTTTNDRVNLMDYGIQLGRRFRSLKLWMVMRAFGAEGLASRVRAHCELARDFAGMVHYEGGGWELTAPVPLSLVCFRYAPAGASEAEIARINAEIMERVNAGGRAYLSHTKLGDRYTLRLAIGNIRTDASHIDAVWRELRAAQRLVTGTG